MKKIILSIILGCFLLTGCDPIVSPIIGIGATGVIKWVEGEAHRYYGYDSPTVYRAVKRAAARMEIPIIEDTPNENNNYYLIVGENNKFKIKVESVEPNISVLKVRIDFMGDKPYAELFYQYVDEELGVIEFGPDGKPMRNRERWRDR